MLPTISRMRSWTSFVDQPANGLMISEGFWRGDGPLGGGVETSIAGRALSGADAMGVRVESGRFGGGADGALGRRSETSARGRSDGWVVVVARLLPPFFLGGAFARVDAGRLPGSGGRVPPCPWVAFQTAIESVGFDEETFVVGRLWMRRMEGGSSQRRTDGFSRSLSSAALGHGR
ncbi:MAG: hypothetical protein ACKO3H_04160 [Verrucomicrobiota bacterium]